MDEATFKELEIFETEDGHKSLFDRVNYTMSFEGSLALKKRFRQPFQDFEGITQTQKAILFLINHLNGYEKRITALALRDIREYIHSNLVHNDPYNGIIGILQIIRFRYKFAGDYFFIKSNIQLLLVFLQEIKMWLEEIMKSEKLPFAFANLLVIIENVLMGIAVSKKKKESWIYRIPVIVDFELDHILRGDLKPRLEELLQVLYEMDAFYSMAKATIYYDLTFPEFITHMNNRKLKITGLRHLFIADAVENDFFTDMENFVLLTGPNMAGKTTFVKAVAIIVFLAHIGMAVPARSAMLPVFNDVFTSINIKDSIQNGRSYFQTEIIRVQELAGKLQRDEKVFAVFDELFRGTNLHDAMECSMLVVGRLLLWKKCFFILSTHLSEIAAHLQNEDDKIKFSYFESSVRNGKPLFTFQLMDGVSYSRLGTLILKEYGLYQQLTPLSG